MFATMTAETPIALGIAGYSGSGKTTFVTTLLPVLIDRGLQIATIKRSHHGFDIFPADHLVNTLRDAGASEVLIAGATNWALMRNAAEEPNPPLTGLLDQCAGSDLVLIEGFKHQPIPKIEIWRPETGVPLLAPADPYIVAIATTVRQVTQLPEESPTPVLDLNDMDTIAKFIVQYCANLSHREEGRRPQ